MVSVMTDVYSTPQYQSFIRAIRERPGDDQPRLACSDWLEENGEEDRAAFIRCQVESAKLERESGGKLPVKVVKGWGQPYEFHVSGVPPQMGDVFDIEDYTPSGGPNRWQNQTLQSINVAIATSGVHVADISYLDAQPCPLRDRWRELKAEEERLYGQKPPTDIEHGGLFAHDMPTCGDDWPPYIRGLYTRGFLESICIRGADWIKFADAILRLNPVREVCLINPEVPSLALEGQPHWVKIGLGRFLGFDAEGAGKFSQPKWPGVTFTFERDDAVTLEARRMYTSIQVSEEYAQPTPMLEAYTDMILYGRAFVHRDATGRLRRVDPATVTTTRPNT